MRKTVRIRYHHEPEGWWAESNELPGWTAAASTIDELRALTRESVAGFQGLDVAIEEDGVPLSAESAVQWRAVTRAARTELHLSGTVTGFFAMNLIPDNPAGAITTVGPSRLIADDAFLKQLVIAHGVR